MVDLSAKVGSITLKNPIVLASGPPGHGPSGLMKYAQAGCGAVVSKTLTGTSRKGNPHPRVLHFPDRNMMNAEGTPNLGEKGYAKKLERFKDEVIKNSVMVISVSGTSLEDYVQMAEAAQRMGAQVVDIDISCPNIGGADKTGGTGNWQLDPGLLRELIISIKKSIDVPLWVKLTSQYANILENARVAEEAGADALIPLYLMGGLAIDVNTGRPLLTFSHGVGVYTGPALKYACIKLVADLCRVVSIPVMASGGCTTGLDAIEFIMAGASAVQVLTAFMYEGPGYVSQIVADMEKFMLEKGYSGLDDFRGLGLKNLPPKPFHLWYRPSELTGA